MGQVLIDQGALKMALNVLRRAGKDEVADDLEKSAVTPEVRTCAHDPKPTGMYEPFDTACGKCGDFCTDAPNVEFSGGAPLHGAASAGTKG